MVSTDYENAIERSKPIRPRGKKTVGDASNVGRTEPFEDGNFEGGTTTQSRDGYAAPSDADDMAYNAEGGVGQGPVDSATDESDPGADRIASPRKGKRAKADSALQSTPLGADVSARSGAVGDSDDGGGADTSFGSGVETDDGGGTRGPIESQGVTYDVSEVAADADSAPFDASMREPADPTAASVGTGSDASPGFVSEGSLGAGASGVGEPRVGEGRFANGFDSALASNGPAGDVSEGVTGDVSSEVSGASSGSFAGASSDGASTPSSLETERPGMALSGPSGTVTTRAPRGTSELGSYVGPEAQKGPSAPEGARMSQFAHGHGIPNQTAAQARGVSFGQNGSSQRHQGLFQGQGGGLIPGSAQAPMAKAVGLLSKVAGSTVGRAAIGVAAFWIARQVLPKRLPVAMRNAGALAIQQALTRTIARYVSH